MRPDTHLQPADSDDPMQRIMPLMVDNAGDHDLARWSRIGTEWARRQELVDGKGRPWTQRQAAESIEADVLANRL